MAQFHVINCKLAHGFVALYAAQPFSPAGERPVVAMIHGALRSAVVLAPWAELLADVADVMLIDLPGHGASAPILPASVPVITQAIGEAIDLALKGRRVLLVGESLGANIALGVGGRSDPGPVRAVFAADPPMSTAKLWSVASNFRDVYQLSPDNTYIRQLGRDALGITPDGIEEILYYPLIEALKVPTVIAAGDVALLPPRQMQDITSLFDTVDRFVLETFYENKAQYRQIHDCGHLVLADAQPQCQVIIREMLDAHLGSPAAP